MTLKIGFIGTGGIAQAHLKHLSSIEGVTASAFVGAHRENSEKAAREWPDAKAFASLSDMLDDRKLDAAYICIPPDAHEGIEELLIERGIPFLLEKPLGVNPEHPRKLAALIEQKQLLTSVGYVWRYADAAAKAKEIMRDVHTGMILGYWMGTMPRAPWWIKQESSGGQFVEQTTHIVDLLRYLCGEITEVYAAYSNRKMHEVVEGADVPDVGTVTMKLVNGAVATISNTCLLPAAHRVGLDIYTDKGTLEIRQSHLEWIQPDVAAKYLNRSQPLYNESAAFIHALKTGDRSPILSDYADSLKTYEITMAANESARTGKPVKVGDA